MSSVAGGSGMRLKFAAPIAFTALTICCAPLIVAPRAAANTYTKYDVSSDGQLSNVTYLEVLTGEEKQITDIPAPWSITLMTQTATSTRRVSAQTTGSFVRCEIILDGLLRTVRTVRAPVKTVECTDPA